jgi:hypothetical protein
VALVLTAASWLLALLALAALAAPVASVAFEVICPLQAESDRPTKSKVNAAKSRTSRIRVCISGSFEHGAHKSDVLPRLDK